MSNHACYICNSSNFTLHETFQCKNGYNYTLLKCDCGFVFLNPKPDENQLSTFYNHSYMPHSKKHFFYKLFRHITFIWKYKKVREVFNINSKDNRIHLDIGSGDGYFSKKMSSKKWISYSYDKYAKLLSSYKNIDNFDDSSIDLITLWHSIEHIHDLNNILLKIKKKIKKNAYIFIACPNINSVDRFFFGANWIAYDIPRHLYHFNPSSIKKLLSKFDFSIIDYIPMYQDTFFNIFLSIKGNILAKIMLFPFYSILFFIINLFKKNKASTYLYICKLN